MANVDIEVIFRINGKTLSDSEAGVRLNDDDVQIASAGLAYRLVEEAWGHVDDEEDF